MENISFRQLLEKDLPEVLDIYTYYIDNSTATCQIAHIDIDEMRRTVMPSSPRYKSFAILSDEELCGYVLYKCFNPREAYDSAAEVTIYLKQGFTGRHIGTAALDMIEKEAAKSGIHALISLVSSENETSIKSFQNCGYEICADFKEVSVKFGRRFGLICLEKLI